MMNLICTRAFYFSVVVLVLLSIILTRIPLFNYLGFEFSFVIALSAGYISGLLMLALWRRQSIQKKNDVWRFILHTSIAVLALLLFPVLIIAANALIVKNCSFGDGILFYALLAIPTVLFSESLAALVAVALERWKKSGFTFLYLLILLHIPFVVYSSPQNFVYNPIAGFFPGFSYDETMHLSRTLWLYRATTLMAALAFFSISVWIWSTKKNRKVSELQQNTIAESILIALIVPFLVMMFVFSDRLGFSSSESSIEQKLGGFHRTPHVDIIYPSNIYKADAVERLAELHEFYYQQLCAQMHVAPSWRLTSFIYESPAQKGKLMGTVQTDITKPWLHQIHINAADVRVGLKHEMTHALAAEWNTSLLHVPMNSNLVEGIAVALGDDVWFGEPLDHAVALIQASGIHISPESMFSNTGFFQSYSGVSYAIAGSFCKYLVDTYGIDTFAKVYAGGNVSKIYQHDISLLVAEWQKKIQQQTLTKNDSVKAAFYFKRSSIFQKDCARVIANQNDETKSLLAQHEYQKALASAERSLRLSKTAEAIFQKSSALCELQQYSETAAFCREQLSDSSISPMLLPLHMRLGDAYWALDSTAKAKSEYQYVASLGFGQWYVEVSSVRLEALSSDEEHALRTVMLLTMEDTARINRLSRLHAPLARYFLAQEYFKQRRYAEAGKLLESFSWTAHPALEYFRLQLLGKTYFDIQELKQAQRTFSAAKTVAPTEPFRIETNEWFERSAFSQR